ncbi:hypothetical protein EMPG_15789 [Blastomyces silverae]|uniref:Uncharacterized protein n=1 Tax=Blastomyces silverae TaxID=2060906 RepID=A0A0H1BBM1_9EURO|nr:hypothetical protein EMPG_15789 [Blastomyces silverae]
MIHHLSPPTLHLLPIRRIIKLLLRQPLPATPVIRPLNLPLNLRRQSPKVAIMVAKHAMRKLVAERLADGPVVAVAIVGIRAQAQFYDFPLVAV